MSTTMVTATYRARLEEAATKDGRNEIDYGKLSITPVGSYSTRINHNI